MIRILQSIHYRYMYIVYIYYLTFSLPRPHSPIVFQKHLYHIKYYETERHH